MFIRDLADDPSLCQAIQRALWSSSGRSLEQAEENDRA
jgi:hypothetical protein